MQSETVTLMPCIWLHWKLMGPQIRKDQDHILGSLLLPVMIWQTPNNINVITFLDTPHFQIRMINLEPIITLTQELWTI